MEKNNFRYELDHDQFHNLIQEIKAVKAFNYKQFKKLTAISSRLLELNSNDELLMGYFREIMSFNFKQYKKLNLIINQMMSTIDPNWDLPAKTRK